MDSKAMMETVDFFKNQHKLPNKQSAEQIINNSTAFYSKQERVGDYEFTIYNYRLASYKDFSMFENLGSLELRGLVFLDNTRFLSLHKFFNYRENPYTEFFIDDNETLYSIDKIDGSLVHPIIFDNKLFVKSKTSFYSEQSLAAKYIIENSKHHLKLIYDCYYNNKVPIFEYISPKNQIVVPYSTEAVVLIAIRDLATGAYMNMDSVVHLCKTLYPNVPVAIPHKYKFSELKTIINTAKDIEGFVVQYNNVFMKLKTNWYLKLHAFISELRPDVIFHLILENKIDDVLCCVEGEKKKQIEDLVVNITDRINNYMYTARKLFSILKETNFDKKSFALNYRNEFLFSPVISSKTYEELENNVKNFLQKKFKTYSQVKKLLHRTGT